MKLWKTFTDCFNCLPIAAIIDEKIFCMHGGLSPELASMDQIKRIMRPTDVPDTGLLCDLLWSDPDKDIVGWGENDRGVSFTFGPDVVAAFLKRHDLDLICRAHQVVEDGYEFFAKRQLVTLFSAPNYCEYRCRRSLVQCLPVRRLLLTLLTLPLVHSLCRSAGGEFDNAGAMMSVDDTLMCSFQILKPADKKAKGYQFTGGSSPMASAAPAPGGFGGPAASAAPAARGFGAPTSTYSPAPAAAPPGAANSNRPGTPPKGKVAAAPTGKK